MTLWNISKGYETKISEENPSSKLLTFISEEGTVHKIQYLEVSQEEAFKEYTSVGQAMEALREGGAKCPSWVGQIIRIFKTEDVQKVFQCTDDEGRLECDLNNFFASGRISDADPNQLDNLVEAAVSNVRQAIQQQETALQQAKERRTIEDQRQAYPARTIHIITGLLATPTEILSGVVLLGLSTTKLALGCLALLGVKAAKHLPKKFLGQTKLVKINRGDHKITSFVYSACRDIRIASLHMVPIIGAQLANQYIRTGSLRGFIDSPAIGGLLSRLGLTIPKIVYGFRGGLVKGSAKWNVAFSTVNPYEREDYMVVKKPTLQQAVDHVDSWLRDPNFNPTDNGITVRIPTFDASRYHDATLLLAEPSQKTTRTVVFYHGNGSHRYHHLEMAHMYRERGYNVLLASYAGDPVTHGDGTTSQEKRTSCSERALREDAAADCAFLKFLGVKHVSVHGWSLGGAQALNFVQYAAAENGLSTVDFIFLDQTFSSMPEVVQNIARRIHPLLGRLAYDFTKKFIADETKDPLRYRCDGLDNVHKLEELAGNEHLDSTRIYCLGASEDIIMGDGPDVNSANDLYNRAVASFGKDRVRKEMQPGGHGEHQQWIIRQALKFLIPNNT